MAEMAPDRYVSLACSHTYYIEEPSEAHGDEIGLEVLRRLEDECC